MRLGSAAAITPDGLQDEARGRKGRAMNKDDDDYDLFDGMPPHQRHSKTSRAAAEDIEQSVGRLQALVLHELKTNGRGTDEELMERTGLAPNTLRPRRRELQLKGLVRKSGEERLTKAGKWAVAWEAVRQ
jgi:predicted HTH transcriptional regulator